MREGLDLPEVSLVAILDADKEGFLRSTRSLIQTVGRASRNIHGKVILYADKVTGSMQRAMEETERRREKQLAFNKEHHITPRSITKQSGHALYTPAEEKTFLSKAAEDAGVYETDPEALSKKIRKLEREMRAAAKELEFEQAAKLRDQVAAMREILVELG